MRNEQKKFRAGWLTTVLLTMFLSLLGSEAYATDWKWQEPIVTNTYNCTPTRTGESHVAWKMIFFNYQDDNSYWSGAEHVWLTVDGNKVLDLTKAMNSAHPFWTCRMFNGCSDEDAVDNLCANHDEQILHRNFTYAGTLGGSITLTDPERDGDKTRQVTVDVCLQENVIGVSHTIGLSGKWVHAGTPDKFTRNVTYMTTGSPSCTGWPSSAGTYAFSGSHKVTHSVSGLSLVNSTNADANMTWGWSIIDYNKKNINSRTQCWDSSSENCLGWKDLGVTTMGSNELTVASNYEPTVIYPRLRTYTTYHWKPRGKDERTRTVGYNKDYDPVTLPGYIRPKNINVQSDPWRRTNTISWDWEGYDSNSSKKGTWVIFRVSPNKTVTKLGTKAFSNGTVTFKDDDSSLAYETEYTYYVAFQPTDWNTTLGSYTDAPDLYASAKHTINRDFSFKSAKATGNASNIKLDWTYSTSFADASTSNYYEVNILKSTNGGSYSNVSTIKVNSSTTATGTYTDSNVGSACDAYCYLLQVDAQGATWTSDTLKASISGVSKVTSVEASRGNYSGTVKLYWKATQVGTSLTYYDVYRRPLGGDGSEWAKIYGTSGTSSSYAYDDISAQAGSYYEYEVQSYTTCTDNGGNAYFTNPTSVYTDGFSMASGVISGRVYFDSGTAVDSVKVTLTSDGEDVENQFHAMYMNGAGSGITYTNQATVKKLVAGKSFSVQMYVRPDEKMTTTSTKYPLFSVPGTYSLYLSNYDSSTGVYTLYDGTTSTGLTLPVNKYTQVSLSYNQPSSQIHIYTIDEESTVKTYSASKTISGGHNASLMLGTDSTGNVFSGYLDEFRFFSGKALTQAEIMRNYNHLLNGTESGLALYWSLDEGISNQKYAYDYSKTGGVMNGRHGVIGANTNSSNIVPSEDQMALMAVTDSTGNYVIRGIPFSGEGTNYVVRPSKGVHDFSPSTTTRYISSSSLVHSAVEFTDVSSFTVSGTAYYNNTTYPVQDATLYVDGVACQRNGELVTTAVDGTFTIDVPIGNHYISIGKLGHTFVNDGRYPESAGENSVNTKTFIKNVTGLTFFDNTLVPVVGRVAGGPTQDAYPLGLGVSTANIGQAVLRLKASDTYRMNVTYDSDEASWEANTNTEDLRYDIPGGAITNSTAYAGSGTDDAARIITITTDPETGEFAALLPPLVYTVQGVEIPSNSELSWNDYDIIDASDVNTTTTDSVDINGVKREFEYVAAYKKIYRTTPVMTVKQQDVLVDGAFGEAAYTGYGTKTLKDENGDYYTTKVPVTDSLYTTKGDFGFFPTTTVVSTRKNNPYTFKYPVFVEGSTYNFDIDVYEQYTNTDNDEVDVVPLSGVEIDIQNALGSGSVITLEDGTDANGAQYAAGSVDQSEEKTVELDSLGHGTYQWRAGMPNIQSPFTRTMSITYYVSSNSSSEESSGNSSALSWEGNGFSGIILGNLPTGNNFVTAGPDEVQMILRDPPGTGSQAYIEEGTTISRSVAHQATISSENEFETDVTVAAKTNVISGSVVMGAVCAIMSDINSEVKVKGGLNVNVEYNNTTTTTEEITTTKRISTSDGFDFVGAMGDVFIGKSQNYIFGNARQVGLYVDDPSEEDVDLGEDNGSEHELKLYMKDVYTMGNDFTTEFSYTQNYVKNTLIPNFESIRNSNLVHVTESEYDSYVNNTDMPIYITMLSPGDEGYGSDNNDYDVWEEDAAADAATEGPSYKMVLPSVTVRNKVYNDTIRWCNQQISYWIQVMRNNEEAKVKAIENRDTYLNTNLSFDAGSSIEMSTSTTNSKENEQETNVTTLVVLGEESEFDVCGTGMAINSSTTTGGGYTNTTTTSTSTSKEVGFSLVEDGDDDALTVDVLNAPDGFGPIFYTRGGQTCCPYEDEVVTEYYKPGYVISTKTQQIEQPHISAEVTTRTGVPEDKPAVYDVILQNTSETGEDCWFNVSVPNTSNPYGAQIFIDDVSLNYGTTILVPAGTAMHKTLSIYKGDNSEVYDFENLLIRISSTCQNDNTGVFPEIADTVALSAHFQRACSDIAIKAKESAINTATGTNLHLTISDYDVNFASLESITLQCQQVGDDNWTNLKTWENDGSDLNVDGTFDYVLDLSNEQTFPDGDYYIRAITNCNYAGNIINNESNELEIYKDVNRPQLIANASPTDGVLNAGDEISVTFNEDIRYGALAKADNFSLKGELNNAEVAHDVAASFTAGDAAKTESRIDLADRSWSVNMWVKYTGAGHILTHGTSANSFDLSVNSSNKLVATVNGNSYTSTNALQKDTWMFLSMSFDGDNNTISANYAYDAYDKVLFANQAVGEYTGNGALALGEGLTGQIHEVTLWNKVRDWAEALSEKSVSKSRYTDGLIGYWKLNEGHGTSATDYSRSRTMVMPGSSAWYLENTNYALNLDGTQAAAANISACGTSSSESYTIEMWFRADQTNTKAASLFSIGESKLDLRLNATGGMEMVCNGSTVPVSTVDYRDAQWHHLALNALKSTSGNATVYVDGQALKSVSASTVPAFNGDYLFLGSHRNTTGSYTYDEMLKGAIDEVRVWKGRRTADVIRNNMYSRVDESEDDLLAYYPFEYTTLDGGMQAVQLATLEDQVPTKGTVVSITMQNKSGSFTTQCTNVQGLKTAPAKQNVDFTFVGSDRKILITPTEEAALMENCTITVKVKGVRDQHNNTADDIIWDVYVRQNQLTWASDEVSVRKEGDETVTFTADIVNSGSSSESWALSDMPSWLSVSSESGTLLPLSTKTLTFTVDPATAAGHYEETINLTGSLDIKEPLVVSLKSAVESPDWSVNGDDYESSMSIVGRLQIDGSYSEDDEDIVAAFNGTTCVGVAHPQYLSRYDSYYLMMTVFGNTEDENSALTFKVFDASEGTIYPVVEEYLNSTKQSVTYNADKLIGDLTTPLIFQPTSTVEQTLSFNKGWNWSSIYVTPVDAAISSIFADNGSDIYMIKNKTIFSQYSSGAWVGSLTTMAPSNMYKVNANVATTTSVLGTPVAPASTSITVANGWNWIGYNCSGTANLNTAFADLSPADGDMVKGKSTFALYTGGEWLGSLTMLTPGQGYAYKSVASSSKSFCYPSITVSGAHSAPAKIKEDRIDDSKFEGNMTMVAVVKKNGETVGNAEIGVYVGTEIRGLSKTAVRDSLYFLTIAGDGQGDKLHFVVSIDEQDYDLEQQETYVNDAMMGSVEVPYVLTLDNATGIKAVNADSEDTLYDVAGRKLDKMHNTHGVYIKNGEKVVK